MKNTLEKLNHLLSARPALVVLGVILCGAYILPYLIKGEGAFILVHDNLDQMSRIPGLEGGRVSNISPHPDRLLFYLFGYFTGYIINELLYRIIGFFGIFLLLKRLVDTSRYPVCFLFLVSVAFAALPFWPQGNLSVAGVPLIALLFVNLYQGRYTKVSLVSLLLFPAYASLVFSGVFVVGVLALILLYLVYKKLPVKRVVIGLGCLVAGYLVFNTDLLALITETGAGHSTRSTMRLSALRAHGFLGSMEIAFYRFLDSQYHAHSYHKYLILPSSLFIFVYLIFKRALGNTRPIIAMWIYLGGAAFICGMWYYKPVLTTYETLGFGFNFSRFYLLCPAIWYVMWALLLSNLYLVSKHKTVIGALTIALLVGQLGINFKHYTYENWVRTPTFEDFVSARQFQAVKQKLRLEPGDKVGCIGFHPAVASYNGFETFGFYRAHYPLTEKQRVYEVIVDELRQNKQLDQYFKYWGSRAYLFDDKIGMYLTDQDHLKKRIQSITCDLNIAALARSDVKYLLSIARIENARERGLREILRSLAPSDYYRLYVYRLPPKSSESAASQR